MVKVKTTTPISCGNCTTGGLWSPWKNGPTKCITAYTWTEKSVITKGKWKHTRTKVFIDCGMYGRQVQYRTCLSAQLGCPCVGDTVRQISCGQSKVCSIGTLPGIDCAPGYIQNGSYCVATTIPPPDSTVTPKINKRCALKPTCKCLKGGSWSDWEWLDSAPCPSIPTYIGYPYRMMRCNPQMCLFPLFRCCNDVDQIKQRLNFNAKRYECMPNPLNKWSLATRTPDPYKGNSTCYNDLQIG
ncbi:unnamed protein product, partial [Mesorhabditis belari]|uniref:Uncharacterized protein n=1 Tax=Mesorhabditis belari TaxID=2138241 RepID=A0AAF3F1S5_9BILA